LGEGASAVNSFLVWFLNIVLGDDFVLMLTMFMLVGAAEYLFPARHIPRKHYVLNLSYASVNVFAVGTLAPFLSLAAAYAIQEIGFGFIDLRTLGFEGMGGGLFAVLVGTLIWDLLQYWQHRAEHGVKLLWRLHVLHHCDEHMNVTTASRHHILELLLAPVFVTIPTAILFQVPPVAIAILSLIPYAWLYFTHANIDLGFGPFWWLLVSPNYHRVHHSLAPEHIDRNFVNWFPLWDILFGTAVAPRWNECPSTGVAGVSVRTLQQAYLLPLKGWQRMLSRQFNDGLLSAPPKGTCLPRDLKSNARMRRGLTRSEQKSRVVL
jgi:sterol desaturase/sphingolipid hydroxylase (fatty acid hydroxylase superfamily)